MYRHGSAALLTALLLVACATPRYAARLPADPCIGQLTALEERAARQGFDPGEPRAVPGFPELGTNRVLAAFAERPLEASEFDDWVARLAEAGQRRRDLLHLVDAAARDGGEAEPATRAAPQAMERCAAQVLSARDWNAQERESLAAAVQVPDDYITAHRVFGLYPLASLPARIAVQRLHERLRAVFTTPLAALPREGRLTRVVPVSAKEPPADGAARRPRAAHDLASAHDSLGMRISRLAPEFLEDLLEEHAPILEIDRVGSYDDPGTPLIDDAGDGDHLAVPHGQTEDRGVGAVDVSESRAYSYARAMPFDGELRLQLVYVFWFDARPRSGPFDTLGGNVDGIVWRVTLDRTGSVLLYDSIHPCGCYHQFFPAASVRVRSAALALPEPPLVPAPAPERVAGERMVLRLASGTHYLQRVYSSTDARSIPARAYGLSPYTELYRVRAPEESRAFFAKHGLVPGSERGERFYLWPMGVRSPGAMRERGRQATAFVGRRHFDDADLLDALFERTD